MTGCRDRLGSEGAHPHTETPTRALISPASRSIAGIRAIAVHAKTEQARTFYQRFDFVESPSDPLHLFALIKDLKGL